jgi:hypothetical protein
MIDQASLNWEDKLSFLFQPDTLLAAEYFENFRRKTLLEPEKRLMLAILEDAVNCFRDNVLANSGRRKKLFEEAEEWILEEGSDWVFSFENICEVFGFNSEYLRKGLLRWKEKRLPRHSDGATREKIKMAG